MHSEIIFKQLMRIIAWLNIFVARTKLNFQKK